MFIGKYYVDRWGLRKYGTIMKYAVGFDEDSREFFRRCVLAVIGSDDVVEAWRCFWVAYGIALGFRRVGVLSKNDFKYCVRKLREIFRTRFGFNPDKAPKNL